MAAVRFIHRICELASRVGDGLDVTLVWDRPTDELRVCVFDTRSGAYFEVDAEHDNALDVFHHPYAYAALQGIPYPGPPETPRTFPIAA